MAKLFRAGSSDGTVPPDEGDPFVGQPVGQLPSPAWLSAPATRAVIDALTREGAEVRFVGGCVRDALAGRGGGVDVDIDLATPHPPDKVMALLEAAGLKAIPTGIAHGTVTAIADGRRFEITTLRRDVETFGRAARVEYTDDWETDAARRDFTFNALSATPDGRVFDPFEGLADLAAGRVRFVGDPFRRIDEDVLRILRYFRFFAHFGRPPADTEALTACRMRATRLGELSGERIATEIRKLLAAADPTPALLLMSGEQVLRQVLPEATDFGPLRQLVFLETRGLARPGIGPDPLRRLAVCLSGGAEAGRAVAERLRFSAKERERLAALAVREPGVVPDGNRRKARQRLYRIGADRFRDLVLLSWARARTVGTRSGETERWLALLTEADSWTYPRMPLNGDDVLTLGVSPGPAVGQALAAIEAWWVDEDFAPDRTQLLERLKENVASAVR